MAVTFAHWQDDRGKLEEMNPEMADLWDRHVGRGVETEPVAGGVEDDPLPDVEDVEKPRLERAARNVLSDEEVREMPLVAPRGRLNEWINDLPPAKVINIQQEL